MSAGESNGEARFARFLESGRVGAIFVGVTGEIRDANDAFLGMVGYGREDLARGELTWSRLEPPGQPRPSRDAVPVLRRLGIGAPVEQELMRKDGTVVPVLIGLISLANEGSDLDHVAFVLDRKERARDGAIAGPTEEQLGQAARMDAIARLAGGVAHDFNNLLTAITGYSELLLVRLAEGEPYRKEVLAIHAAGQRAAALTGQLLAFSRKQLLQPRVLALGAVVGELTPKLRDLVGPGVALVVRHAEDLAAVKADPGQLEQVIVSLALEAREAMPGGGTLTLETRDVRLGDVPAHDRAELAPGDYVLLAVSHTGASMTPEARARAFEPFSPARSHQKGAGLRLSTVYGIAKQTGGHVVVSSEPGRGATFGVYLPRAGEAPAASPQAMGREASTSRGRETVLVVEDDNVVRSLVRELLQAKGFKVLEAVDGAAGLLVAEKHKGTIELLLTNVVLPGIGGRDLAARVTALRRETRVLFMSGYTNDDHRDFLGPDKHFIAKPFSPAALASAVRRALEGRL